MYVFVTAVVGITILMCVITFFTYIYVKTRQDSQRLRDLQQHVYKTQSVLQESVRDLQTHDVLLDANLRVVDNKFVSAEFEDLHTKTISIKDISLLQDPDNSEILKVLKGDRQVGLSLSDITADNVKLGQYACVNYGEKQSICASENEIKLGSEALCLGETCLNKSNFESILKGINGNIGNVSNGLILKENVLNENVKNGNISNENILNGMQGWPVNEETKGEKPLLNDIGIVYSETQQDSHLE